MGVGGKDRTAANKESRLYPRMGGAGPWKLSCYRSLRASHGEFIRRCLEVVIFKWYASGVPPETRSR